MWYEKCITLGVNSFLCIESTSRLLLQKARNMVKMRNEAKTAFEGESRASAMERRRHFRYMVDLPLDCSRIDEKHSYGGIVVNASEGGILVYLPERYEVGTSLKIEIFYVRDTVFDHIKATARVVRSEGADKTNHGQHRYALQFQSMESRDFNRLVAFLKEKGM